MSDRLVNREGLNASTGQRMTDLWVILLKCQFRRDRYLGTAVAAYINDCRLIVSLYKAIDEWAIN